MKIPVTALRNVSEIKRVYSGRPGCACGCRGTYWPSSDQISNKDRSMFKRVNGIFQANLASAYTYEEYKDQFVALDVSVNRTYTIYYQ